MHRLWTADEVMRMVEAGVLGEDEPVELLDGELVVMSPQGPPHAVSTTRLHHLLLDAYRGKGVDVREDKPLAASRVSLPEPDLAVVRGEWDTFGKRHPRGDETLLVIEVARTSLAIDRAKAAIYAAARVPEYWIVDYEARRIEVYSDPRGRAFASVRTYSADDAAPLPGTDAALRPRDFIVE